MSEAEPGPPPRPGGARSEGRGARVEVDDRQDQVAVAAGRLRVLAEEVLAAEGVQAGAEVGLLFVDEAAMADLNLRHMGVAGPTDVLAFPLDGAGATHGGAPELDGGSELLGGSEILGDSVFLVGDVVVCPTVARRAADERGEQVEDELALLVVHGMLHLLGHDHAEPAEAAEMQQRERDLLGRLMATRP